MFRGNEASGGALPAPERPDIAEVYDALLRVAEDVGRLTDLDDLLGRIVRLTAETAHVDACALHLLDEVPRTGTLRFVVAHGLRPAENDALASHPLPPRADPTWDHVRETRLFAAFSERERNVPPEWHLLPPCRAGLVVPLLHQDHLIGCLAVGMRQGPGDPFDLFTVTAVSGIANQAAVAIQNARLYAQTRDALRALTESQQRLVETERLRALGEMSAGVAHNFSNTIAGILGNAQLALRRLDDRAAVERYLRTIERAALEAQATVRRIRAFSAAESSAPAEPSDLSALVRDALALLRPQWVHRADLRLQTDLPPLPPVPVAPAEIGEVLVNLLVNAVQAMPGGGTLSVATFARARHVGVRVSDTGVGMSPEARARAFEPFFTTKGEAGTGLGLSTAYGTVTRYGGTITLRSRPGQGTRVEIRFPLPKAAEKDGGATR